MTPEEQKAMSAAGAGMKLCDWDVGMEAGQFESLTMCVAGIIRAELRQAARAAQDVAVKRVWNEWRELLNHTQACIDYHDRGHCICLFDALKKKMGPNDDE